MHKLTLFLGAVALGAMTTGASAELVNVPDFDMPEHSTAGGDDPLLHFDLLAADGVYTDVIITFDFMEPAPDATWASDMVAQMDFGGYIVDMRGTFTGSGSALDPLAADENAIWDFDGAGSGDDGTYATAYTFLSPVTVSGGTFHLDLSDVWDGGYSISNMTIELVPTPGALALLGLAGLAGRRRRR